MKLLIGLLALVSAVCFANISNDNAFLLNHIQGSEGQKSQLGTLLNQTQGLLIAKYSFAVQGGSSAADISLITDLKNINSLAKLPNNAVIEKVWLDVITQPTSTGSATVAVKASSAGDLLAATAKASLTVSQIAGVPDDTVTHMIKLSAQKTIKATVGVKDLTAGRFNVYIRYTLGEGS